jgi:hypothetical protein
MDFAYFKSVIGITLVLALLIAFMNMLSLENTKLLLESKPSQLA